jgi:hypothetical protein
MKAPEYEPRRFQMTQQNEAPKNRTETKRRFPPSRERLVADTPDPLQALVDRLKAERVQGKLALMPDWRLRPGAQAVERTRELSSNQMAGAYAAFVQQSAGFEGQPVHVMQLGSRVLVVVFGRPGQGGLLDLEDKALDFAKVIG